MRSREVQTCIRCRDSKRRCDKAKPSCTRCQNAGLPCLYDGSQASFLDPQNTPPFSTEPSPSSSSDEPVSRSSIKRRDRAILSCTRCHRLKVKCDKREPCCGRCARSGYGRSCVYTHRAQRVELKNSPPPFLADEQDPEAVVALWFMRKRGSSHWKALLARLESLSGLGDPPFQWLSMAVQEHLQGDCAADLTLPGNFPFGSPESAQYTSLDKIFSLLKGSRVNAPHYLKHYASIYNASLPICDVDKLRIEVDRFWEAPDNCESSWLAQYLAVLGLGAFACGKDENEAAEFFFASEACLARTSYMFRPTVTHVRTLCLLVLAKQVAYATCWALDACWNIMGLIVRLVLMMGLHQECMPSYDIPGIVEERQQRNRLWYIVVYLDIQMSLITGQTSPLPQEALLGVSQSLGHGPQDELWGTILPASFPIICHFLARVNSGIDMITYEEVLQYDSKVRQLMRHADTTTVDNPIMRITANIFYRRVLLVLHRRHALDPEAPTLYPTSYWSSLECSLALIIHHRDLSDQRDLEENVHLLARPFMLDFFAAAVTTCIHLLSTDAPLAAPLNSEETIPPRQTISNTLDSCLEIFAKEQHKSVCFSTGYRLLTLVYGMLPKE